LYPVCSRLESIFENRRPQFQAADICEIRRKKKPIGGDRGGY
jgi:hypothetical protein